MALEKVESPLKDLLTTSLCYGNICYDYNSGINRATGTLGVRGLTRVTLLFE